MAGYEVRISNTATKLQTSVLFASEDTASNDLCSAWEVFNQRHTSLILSKALFISFQYFINGERVSLGPYSCERNKSWIVTTTNDGEEDNNSVCVVLKPNPVERDQVKEDESFLFVKNYIPSSWQGTEGTIRLYRNNSLFLLKKLEDSQAIRMSESPNLYFGLTSQPIEKEDIFTNRKLFSPLAKIDQSYYSTGIDVEITDNPAGRPHAIIKKI